MEELAELIPQALPEDDGAVELQPGMHFRKYSSRGKRIYGSYPPACRVVAQGSKDIFLGDEAFHYNATKYLITTDLFHPKGMLSTCESYQQAAIDLPSFT